MAPLVALCAFDPLLPLLSPEQYKYSVSLSEFSSPLFMRLGCSQSSESKDGDSPHLVFTMNDGNICVTRTGLSVLLQPYFGGIFHLISILFLFGLLEV